MPSRRRTATATAKSRHWEDPNRERRSLSTLSQKGRNGCVRESDVTEEEPFLCCRRWKPWLPPSLLYSLESLQLELVTGGGKRLYQPLRFDTEPVKGCNSALLQFAKTTNIPILLEKRSPNAVQEKGFNFDDTRIMRGAWRNESNLDICKIDKVVYPLGFDEESSYASLFYIGVLQMPCYISTNAHKYDSSFFKEEEVEIEKACKEVEEFKEEHKGVELARPLPKSSPSNTTFKWVKFLSLTFTFLLEYGLLETDGQLRALCGIKSKRKMISGKSYQARFKMVACSKLKCKDWCRAQLNGSRRLFGYLCENSNQLPPGGNNGDPQEDGCKSKVWDPGIYSHNQHYWSLVTCFNLLEGVMRLVWNPGGYWINKHWWRFLDQYKHKPP
ncbi:hypothetical protein AHAS_Ahas15G0249100 [Arachis hypogaea]